MAKRLSLGLVLVVLVVLLVMNWTFTKGQLSRKPTKKPAAKGAPRESGEGIPGGRDENTALAINNPHEFAWRLFLALNRQALLGKAGVPDPARPTIREGQPGQPAVWETWALASGGRAGPVYVRPNRSEVFKDRGARPVPWDKLPRRSPQPKVFEPVPGKGLEFLLKVGRAPGKFDPVEDGEMGGLEVRMNRSTYDYVRANNLYSIEGLEERFKKGKEMIFPRQAKEIKARWVRIKEKDKPRYHWRIVQARDGTKQLWGLSALHIITRDLPNWFWCDFEHVDFERHAEQYSVDPTTRGEKPPSGRNGIRHETRGTRWQTMRLRGTQTAFVDERGRPTILANSQIEHGFQQTSSCLTCHARATVGLRSARPGLPGWQTNTLPPGDPPNPVLVGPVGAPDPRQFLDEFGNVRYRQTHFLWSVPFRAMSTKVSPP